MIPRRGIIGWISAAAGFAAGQAWDLIKTVQAATRPAGKGEKAPIKARTTPVVQLFGLPLGTQADGTVDRPNAFWVTGSWNVRVNSLVSPTSLMVDIALVLGDTFVLNAKFVLNAELLGSDIIRPSVVQPAQDPKAYFRFTPKGKSIPTLPVYVDNAFFAFSAASGETKWIGWIDDTVGFATTGGTTWQHAAVPLEVAPQPAYWQLDLSNTGVLASTEQSLAANCFLIDLASTQRTQIAQLWSSRISIPLAALPPLTGIEFSPIDENVRLPLGSKRSRQQTERPPRLPFSLPPAISS